MDKTKLLDSLKSKLNITWDDEDTNNKILDMIEDAKSILDYKLGADIDYSKHGMEHRLFLNYCLYEWNDCVNEFDTNYLNEIYQLRAKYEVMNYEKTEV